MIRKILAIMWKEVYQVFTDRNLLLIMIVAPLAISAIVSFAFGGGSGGNLTLEAIPVAIINLDEGAQMQGQTLNYGSIFTNLLVPGEDSATDPTSAFGGDCPLITDSAASSASNDESVSMSLEELFDAVALDDVAAGRAGVDNGDYAALIVIPADFSARLLPMIQFGEPIATDNDPAAVEVYANEANPISVSILRSVAQGFTDQIVTGSIAISASINTLIETNPLAAASLGTNSDAMDVFTCGFSGVLNTIDVDRRALAAEAGSSNEDEFSLTTFILIQVGAAQAVFFALFTGQFGVVNIIEERKTWTLQRMVLSPTPRAVILGGNLLGTFITVIFQITLLLASLTLFASFIEGGLTMIFGSNLLLIAALVLVLGLAVSALGVFIAGLARTTEQATGIGSVVNLAMGVLGGAFGFVPGPPASYFSMIYWGTDAFNKLAIGQTDIGLNLLILAGQGLVLYLIGLVFFNRRLDI
jgi:ABC-2 type transport system permease protein